MAMTDLSSLPPALDVPTAAALLGIGRTSGYELIRRGEWPTPVVRLGRQLRIPSRPLLALLGVKVPTAEPIDGPTQ